MVLSNPHQFFLNFRNIIFTRYCTFIQKVISHCISHDMDQWKAHRVKHLGVTEKMIYDDSHVIHRNNSIVCCSAGSVILEMPVLPVMEGEAVTLHCRNKTASNLSASFYKNGLLIKNVSIGNLIIHSVSKSDEGLYKCSISGAGGSPVSWLNVRGER